MARRDTSAPAEPDEEVLQRIEREDEEADRKAKAEGKRNARATGCKITPPTLETWEEACRRTRGRRGRLAEAFDVSENTIDRWRAECEGFEETLNHPREIMMDKLEDTAEILALGKPDIDENGKFAGWLERPDVTVLLRLMKAYGMHRGFGDNPQEVNVRVKGGGIPIAKWLELNTETNEEDDADSDT